MSSYKYDQETVEALDILLDAINKSSRGQSKGEILKKLARDEENLPKETRQLFPLKGGSYLTILREGGFIRVYNNDRYIIVTPEGTQFFKQGGFAGEMARHQALQQQSAEDAASMKRLKDLQIEELEKRLASAENTLKEQSEFWRTSSDRNMVQMKYYKWAIRISVTSLIVSIVALVVSLLSE